MSKLTFEYKSYRAKEFNGGTIFLIAAFKSKGWFYTPTAKALLKEGYNVYVYDYPWRPLLEAHPEQWVELGDRVTSDIVDKIAAEKHKHVDARFGVIGVSVGSALAMHVAKTVKELEKIMLVTLYGSSAQHVWEHPILKKMRAKFEASNLSVDDAAQVFGFLEPLHRLDLIGKRKILLYANERDPVIRFSNTQLFIKEAEKSQVDLVVRRVHARRHSTTILKVFREPPLWTPFFKDLKHHKPNVR